MTEAQKVRNWFKRQGFTMSPVLLHHGFTPNHRKTNKGHHNIIDSIHYCMFEGVNTEHGGIGCVTFCYYGIERRKFQRYKTRTEILKYASSKHTTADEVIEAFHQWSERTEKTLASWEVIL